MTEKYFGITPSYNKIVKIVKNDQVEYFILTEFRPRDSEDSFLPSIYDQLFKLAKDCFPNEPQAKVIEKTINTDLLYFLSPKEFPEKIIGLASRNIYKVRFQRDEFKELSGREVMIDPNFRNKGLSYHLIFFPIAREKPDIYTTVTQVPAIYIHLKRICALLNYKLWPNFRNERWWIPKEIWVLTREILRQRNKNYQSLDECLVRRGIYSSCPFERSPYLGYAPFEKLISDPRDAIFFIALRGDVQKRIGV